MYWNEQTFEGFNLRMLNATFECLHNGNLSSPGPLHQQPKDEIILHNAFTCVPNSLI